MKRRAIVWFRQDLRIHDNEAIQVALRNAEELIPVYVFDERIFKGETRYGFAKTGVHRARFIIESVLNLRKKLRELGSDLVIRVGKPEDILFEMATTLKASWVICNRERTDEEVKVQDALEQQLWTTGIELWFTRGKMLYNTQDLPMPVQHTPDVFSTFRKENEQLTPVRQPLPSPTVLPPLPKDTKLESGDVPTLESLGHKDIPVADERAVLPFEGGEEAALSRLRYYLWDKDLVATYKETRNGLIGGDYSTKFSPYLSQGCLSPKMIYQELKRYERERVSNDSTYWVFFELLWRDFFRLMGKKYKNNIFKRGGTQSKKMPIIKENVESFNLWAQGRTGVPFVDANMRELNATGWMSNRGRQNTASFLVKDLKVNWQMGAEYFESMLLDYDPCSNWGNWNYVAGVGSDPREDRYFNILTQAKNYDPQGEYVKLWCEELRKVPADKIHRPDLLSNSDKSLYGATQYPKSLVKIEKWAH
jgi:deoxyribodipyrimidine photo-lyase